MSGNGRKLNHNITIKDVAREAGVSYSTVSRVVNNSAGVREDKRQRVMEAITRLGYVVNQQARTLAGGRSQVIGLLIPDLGNGYTGTVVAGIDEALAEHRYDMMLHTTHHVKTKESVYVQMLTRGMTDGLLLLLPQDPGAYLQVLRGQHFPYVVIDHQGFDDFSSTVVSNNYQGAYEATEYLIELGHRRIGFASGSPHTSSATERQNAYIDALRANDIQFHNDYVMSGNFNQQDGYRAGVALLNLPEPPTAIFAANDLSAYGVVDAARERGLRIPQDISIMGFDDIPQSQWITPALTTVRQPLIEMGREAVEMLMRRIESPTMPRERIELPTKLVIRDTCRAITDYVGM